MMPSELAWSLHYPSPHHGFAAFLRAELVQVAAVAQAMVECGDRNGWWKRPKEEA